MKDRTEAANEILRAAVANFLVREAGPQSLITVVRTEFTEDLTRAVVWLSVLPQDQERAAFSLAERLAPELKQYLKQHTKLPRIPYLEFKLAR